MRTLSRILNRALESVLVTLLLALVALVSVDTFLWTLFAISYAELAEVQGLLQIWFGMLGAAYGVRQGFHLGVEVLVSRIPKGLRRVVSPFGSLLVGIVGVLLLRYGAALTMQVTNRLPASDLPAAMQYVPTWVAGALIVFFALERVIFGAPPEERPMAAGAEDG